MTDINTIQPFDWFADDGSAEVQRPQSPAESLNFAIRQDDALILAKHWVRELVDIFVWIKRGFVGGSSRAPLVYHRLDLIIATELVSESEVKQWVDEEETRVGLNSSEHKFAAIRTFP